MKQRDQHSAQDDPRLTAYALGELDVSERADIEALLEREPDARAQLEGVRSTARVLEESFAGAKSTASAPGLSAAQRATLEGALAPRRPRVRVRTWVGLAAAAGLLAVTGVSLWIRSLGTPPHARAESARTALRSLGYTGAAGEQLDPSILQGLGYGGPVAYKRVSTPPVPGRRNLSLLEQRLPQGTEVDEFFDGLDREGYEGISENPFLLATDQPLSTFSIDVDTASYSNARRMLVAGELPPADAVRIEEFVNYFPYAYAPPAGEAPFSVNVEVGAAPWQPEHRLVRIGLKGRESVPAERPSANLVFLLDVSGSMNSPNKLPLLKRSMQLLVQHLGPADRVAIVVYAGASGLVLPSTSCAEPLTILQALEQLEAGGSTNGAAGIELAYRIAQEHSIEDGINRVILATDGDFNVGITSDGALERLIAEKARTGVFLSVLGFGMGNYQDATLQKLSGRGNGNFAYIDSVLEAKKVLVEQLGSTLETIAKDVKIQVDFNPLEVKGYRLIGYENRLLAAQDFLDDKKDAGEIGAGHTVTALYELVPAGGALEVPGIEPSKYTAPAQTTEAAQSGELLTVRLRFKRPDADESEPLEVPVLDLGASFSELSDDTRFAAAVAAFGMLLRDSAHAGSATLDAARTWALEASGPDAGGYRRQFVQLVERAREIRADVSEH